MIVKVCGMTNGDDARRTIEAGADWIGLNLFSGPRQVDPAAMERIVSQMEDPSRAVVLVNVDGPGVSDSRLSLLRSLGVCRLQLYGKPTSETVQRLARAGFASVAVQPVAGESSLDDLESFLVSCVETRPDYVLLDASVAGRLGGTGRRADWDTIIRARKRGRFERWPPVLLAGGLSVDNVDEAVRVVLPAGVDVSSGVEAEPGRKDIAKVRAFLAAARRAAEDSP